MPDACLIDLTVNGEPRTVSVRPNDVLLDVLRDRLDLRGPKECCSVGECGACTVLVDGRTVNACLMLAVEAQGTEVVTIEGVGRGGMTRLQEAFLEHGAVQCGFCIPGMLMSAHALLDRDPNPDDDAIREALSGNLCRCAGYYRMFDAVRAVAGAGSDVAIPNAPSDRAVPLVSEAAVQRHGEVRRNRDTAVGSSVKRFGGLERVRGTQAFLADIPVPDLLHVKLVKVDAARAKILSIDAEAARAVPGVVDVVTARDLPQPVPRFGPVFDDRPVLADGETQYHGEPVAAVVADTKAAAALAAALVKVDFEVLPAAVTLAEALAPEAPLVQDAGLRPGDPLAQTNVLKARSYGWGDVGAARADLVVENAYTFPMVTHFAIEPHGFMAKWDEEHLTVWSPVQHPFLLQKVMAKLFKLPLTQVRVLAPDPGGGFGGKQNPKFEPLVAILAMRARRPCRLVLTLEETFQAVRRAATEVRVRTGFSRAGDILFQDVGADFLLGAYADIGERVMTKASYLAVGPYRVPNARIRARAVLSHTTPSCAFRGFGTPQINWAVEANINEGARRLGLDGYRVRLRNLASRGDEIVKDDVPADGLWPESLKRAADAVGWDEPLPPGRGRGIAVGIKSGATTGLSNSTIRFLADGSIIVYAGTSDMGQGARTIFAQLAADALGVPLSNVSVVMGDTAVVPFDLQTSASRSTVFMGTAITRACADIHAQLREMAVELTGADPDDVSIHDGVIAVGADERSIPEFVAAHLGRWNGELIGNGRMRKPHVAKHPLGGGAAFYEFNCTAFEAEVDRDTGEITIHKHVTVGDVGKALNPVQVEAQDEGAAIMGLGHTLMEHILLDEGGRIRNLGAIDYRIPTSRDLPKVMRALMVENEDGPGPHGAKGVSEGGLLCTAPALAAAVTQATGVTFHDLPLTPERVWRTLRDAEARGDAGAD